MASTLESPAASANTLDFNAQLFPHLSTQYNIQISQITALDQAVFRIDRHDGPSWVARIFSATHSLQTTKGDAEILHFLAQQNFPAERCPAPTSVSQTPSGHPVLVTEFVEGRRPRKGEQLFPKLGTLLGRLQSLEMSSTGPLARSGGAWHHICAEGGPREEIQATIALLTAAKKNAAIDQHELYDGLLNKLGGLDNFSDLPHAFIHPDFVPSNIITAPNGDLIVVDWAGAGTGPRLPSLGFLLWAAGHRSMAQVEAVMRGYCEHVSLQERELARLASAICFRPLVLRCWEVCMGRSTLHGVVEGLPKMENLAERIASVACEAVQTVG